MAAGRGATGPERAVHHRRHHDGLAGARISGRRHAGHGLFQSLPAARRRHRGRGGPARGAGARCPADQAGPAHRAAGPVDCHPHGNAPGSGHLEHPAYPAPHRAGPRACRHGRDLHADRPLRALSGAGPVCHALLPFRARLHAHHPLRHRCRRVRQRDLQLHLHLRQFRRASNSAARRSPRLSSTS